MIIKRETVISLAKAYTGFYSKEAYDAMLLVTFKTYLDFDNDGELLLVSSNLNCQLSKEEEEKSFKNWLSSCLDYLESKFENNKVPLKDKQKLEDARIIMKTLLDKPIANEKRLKELRGCPFDPFIVSKIDCLKRTMNECENEEERRKIGKELLETYGDAWESSTMARSLV